VTKCLGPSDFLRKWLSRSRLCIVEVPKHSQTVLLLPNTENELRLACF
jgi:hypothetical protein